MPTQATEKLYKTREAVRRTVRVRYPSEQGRIVLRTEKDWDKDVEPIALSEDGTTWTFSVEADQPFLYFKPCLVRGDVHHWAVGPNNLLLMTEPDRRMSHPFFFSPDRGRFSSLLTLDSAILGREHRLRVFLPPGYDENTLAAYPIGDSDEVAAVYTAGHARRAGLGAAVVAATIADIHGRGRLAFYIAGRSNQPSRRLAERIGLRPIGETCEIIVER